MLLSFDVLGNPRGLFKRMATGVSDAFYEPLNGLMQGPEQFAHGVVRGGKSLRDNVVHGVSDSISKFSGTLAKGMAELSMDDDYLERRSAASTALGAGGRPKSAGGQVLDGIAKGVTGVVSKPLAGARSGGVGGFFAGLATGASGLVVKSLVGAADGISTATESIRDSADRRLNAGGGSAYARASSSSSDAAQQQGVFAQRERPPRALGPHGELLPYSRGAAEAQQLLVATLAGGGKSLRTLSEGRYCGHATYGGPREPSSKRLVVTTTHAISLDASGEYEWSEPLSRVGALEESGEELMLHLRDGGIRFVPCIAGSKERKACFELVDRCLRSMAV